MKEYDKPKSHKSSKLHMIYISSNNVRHPVTKILTTLQHTFYPTILHSTSLHFSTLYFLPFKLHPTTLLHFTTHSFGLTPLKFLTAPFHLTSLHFTLFHFSCFLYVLNVCCTILFVMEVTQCLCISIQLQ